MGEVNGVFSGFPQSIIDELLNGDEICAVTTQDTRRSLRQSVASAERQTSGIPVLFWRHAILLPEGVVEMGGLMETDTKHHLFYG